MGVPNDNIQSIIQQNTINDGTKDHQISTGFPYRNKNASRELTENEDVKSSLCLKKREPHESISNKVNKQKFTIYTTSHFVIKFSICIYLLMVVWPYCFRKN